MPELHIDIPDSLAQALAERKARTGESTEQIVLAALADALEVDHATLFQISNSTALTQGVFDGVVSMRELKEHGDFGLGTFDGLDGEMIALDGTFYRADAHGVVNEVDDAALAPFAVITEFPDEQPFALGRVTSFKDLTAQLDLWRQSENLFYAVRLDGHFARIKARAFPRQVGGTSLADAASAQSEFTFTDVDATLVGFWTPTYARTINVAGWHLHAITADRQRGGHLLDVAGTDLQVRMAELTDVRMAIPETEDFLEADLTQDVSEQLARAESDH